MENTELAGAAPPSLTSGCKLIGESERKGYRLCTWRDGDDDYFVVITRDGDHAFDTTTHPNRGHIELEAERWIDKRVAEADGLVVNGWRLILADDNKGAKQVHVTDVETGELAPLNWRGYLSSELALEEATEWAKNNPPRRAEAEPDPTSNEGAEGQEANEVAEAAVDPVAAVAPLAPATAQPTERLPAVADVSAQLDPRVDTTWTLLQDRKRLRDERRRIERELNTRKARIKAIDEELVEVDAQLDHFDDSPHDNRQAVLPLSPAPRVATQEKLATESPRVADRLKPGEERWAFNGFEHTIVITELEPDRWRAHLKVKPTDTEGFGETRDQAIAACQARASDVFADCDPGSLTPTPDGGPVADGIRKPPRRKAKAKLKGKSKEEVIAALRGAMNLADAAQTLGCTEDELQEFTRTQEIKLSENLARDIGADEPAPARKPKRGGKNRGSRGGR